jgi:hypothetical protein
LFYVAANGSIQDDGLGDGHPPYAVDARGQRHPVTGDIGRVLASRYAEFARSQPPQQRAAASMTPPSPAAGMPFTPQDVAAMRSMFPLGDIVASLTSAVGIQPCEPCKRRQEMLNSVGDRFARRFWGR